MYLHMHDLTNKPMLTRQQEAIKKCNNMSGYAWEDPLKVRLRVTMDQLKHGGVLDDSDSSSPPTSASTSASSSSSSFNLLATNGAEPPTTTKEALVIEAS